MISVIVLFVVGGGLVCVLLVEEIVVMSVLGWSVWVLLTLDFVLEVVCPRTRPFAAFFVS